MKAVFYTNKGPVREHNEDALFTAGKVFSCCDMTAPEVNEDDYKCFAVIDGMGGYNGGEVAARIVAESLTSNNDWDINASECKIKLREILSHASGNIRNVINTNPELSSHMGSALAGIIFCSDRALIFNCGDCRIYRQQGQYLEKLSHDHSVVQELRDRGEIDEEDMRTHPRKNVITACVSANSFDLDIYFREVQVLQHQKFLLCSDGVWEALSINELEACVSSDSESDSLSNANNLVQALLNMNSLCRDNISFIIIESD